MSNEYVQMMKEKDRKQKEASELKQKKWRERAEEDREGAWAREEESRTREVEG